MTSFLGDVILHRKAAAWLVHLFTSSSAIFGLFAMENIYRGSYISAFWFMGAALFVDAIDGTLARAIQIKRFAPKIDGALLDNIVDYFNYVIVPAFLLLVHENLLPQKLRALMASLIVVCSAYQFCQRDAKTKDNFFKGFPSYWNIAVFQLFMLDLSPEKNFLILFLLCALVFVPIKYVYPSRLDNFAKAKATRFLMLSLSILYGVFCFLLLFLYPQTIKMVLWYTNSFIVFYFLASIYRTFYPLKK